MIEIRPYIQKDIELCTGRWLVEDRHHRTRHHHRRRQLVVFHCYHCYCLEGSLKRCISRIPGFETCWNYKTRKVIIKIPRCMKNGVEIQNIFCCSNLCVKSLFATFGVLKTLPFLRALECWILKLKTGSFLASEITKIDFT